MCQFSLVRFRLFDAWNVRTVIFFPFLFSGYIFSVDIFAVCIISDRWNQSSYALLWSLLVLVSMHRRNHRYWQDFFLLFLIHAVCLRHLLDVRLYASFLVLWSICWSSSFVPSVLREGQPRCLSLWWDFALCSLVSSFTGSPKVFLKNVFHLFLFDGVRFQYFKY